MAFYFYVSLFLLLAASSSSFRAHSSPMTIFAQSEHEKKKLKLAIISFSLTGFLALFGVVHFVISIGAEIEAALEQE